MRATAWAFTAALLSLLLTSTASAQSETWHVCISGTAPAEDENGDETFDPRVACRGDEGWEAGKRMLNRTRWIGTGWNLIVWFGTRDAASDSAYAKGLREVVLTLREAVPPTDGQDRRAIRTLHSEEVEEDTFGPYVWLPLENISSWPNRHFVEISLRGVGDELLASSRYFRVLNRTWLTLYGVGGRETLVWFPVGLVATDFRAGENGIPFSAFPVGVALGGRLNWTGYRRGRAQYIGMSAMANYAISAQSNVVEDPTMPGTDTRERGFSLTDVAFGVLFDLSGYVYVGYAYGLNLREGEPNPGHLAVFGFAPGLLQSLQGRPKD